MDLNYFDMVLLVILVLFLLRGIMNGFLAEFSGLLGLFGGLWYANSAYKDVSPYLAKVIQQPVWRDLAAYGLVFVSVLMAVALLLHIVSKLLSLAVLTSLDKVLGAALGLMRGIAICSVSLVILHHFLPDMHFFHNSLVTPWMEPFLHFAKLYLPASLV
ncbi:MAG: CvpA family protein [Betaproteobacteria bacterium]|nr:CvpA family protein [Betaproteobacteria bacterium]